MENIGILFVGTFVLITVYILAKISKFFTMDKTQNPYEYELVNDGNEVVERVIDHNDK